MNLKEKIQEAALEYSKTWNNYQLQIMAKECFTEGAEKTIELLSSGGEFKPFVLTSNEEVINVEALAAANLKISQLEEKLLTKTIDVAEHINKLNTEKIQQLESENEVLKAKLAKAVEQRNIENLERLNLIYRDGNQNKLSFEQCQEMDFELNAITKETVK